MAKRDQKKNKLVKIQKRAQRRMLLHSLKPLLFAFIAWFVVNSIVHIPVIKEPFNAFFINFTTHSVYWFGKIFFIPIEMPAVPYLTLKGFHMKVIMECTAYTFYIFAVAVVVFARWPLKHKIYSLVFLLVGILFINIMRFIVVGYVGTIRPDAVDFTHDIVWNVLFGIMVFGLWFVREIKARRLMEGAGS